MDIHETFMQRCFQLALMGSGNVSPNPMVGAVLVHQNRIIGEGYHMEFGKPHAEVNCINSVPISYKNLLEHSTLYVSLEPCNHHGKTPPCTEFIIDHKIPGVIIACEDNYEKAGGSGIRKLESAGIRTISGVLESEATELNKRFFTFHTLQRPYIILKWAQSANGKIAGDHFKQVKISNEITDRIVHKWRSEEAAIIVGYNTAKNDNPSLTTRLVRGNNPVRIVLDKHLQLPAYTKLLDDSTSTIIINSVKQEERGNTLFYKTSQDENMIAVVINLLHLRKINSLIVEGGAKLLQSFIDQDIWDEARVITNNVIDIPGGISAPVLRKTTLIQTEKILSDDIRIFRNIKD